MKHEHEAENIIHNNYIHETQQAAMRNYVLTQKKIGDTISSHGRLKEILNNIKNIILYLQAFKLRLSIGYSWKK